MDSVPVRTVRGICPTDGSNKQGLDRTLLFQET